jgi:hypothetical protein
VLEDAIEASRHSGLDYLSVLSVLEELKKEGNYANTQVLAFHGLMRCIEEIIDSIKSIMASDLLDNVKLDEEACMSRVLPPATQLPDQLKENGAGGHLDDNVVIILSGLYATDHLNEAMQMCREYMLVTGTTLMTNCVKRCLGKQDGLEDDGMSAFGPLFGQLDGKAMLQLLESCFFVSKIYVQYCDR